MFSLTWKYFCLQVSIFLHHWYSFKILFFFSQRAHCSQKTSLAGQWLWEISVEWELRNCDYWAVVNPSHENIWMWERIDIILPVAGEHKCKATVQLVRITRHEYPWVDIHYKNTATLRVPNPCRKTSENIAFWSNADTIYYSVTHGSTELADLLEGPVHVGGESANWCMVLLLNRSWHSHHHSVVPEYALWLSRGHECRCHPAHKNNFKKDGWQKFCQFFFFSFRNAYWPKAKSFRKWVTLEENLFFKHVWSVPPALSWVNIKIFHLILFFLLHCSALLQKSGLECNGLIFTGTLLAVK